MEGFQNTNDNSAREGLSVLVRENYVLKLEIYITIKNHTD